MHTDLEQAIAFHDSIIAEGGKALVGYDTAKALANVVLMSEIPTSYDKMAQAEVILLDEINRIPLKSQSAFLEALQDRTVTVGHTTFELPAFSFAIATMNPVELGQGTFPLSEAATDRFAIMVNIGYLPPEEETKLVHFDFKKVRLNPLMTKERIIHLRGAINERVFLHERLGAYIQRLVAATRPYNPDTDWLVRSPSELVEHSVDLGASPRAIICWGRLAKVWALLVRRRTEVYPEDIQDLAPHILRHRIWLGPHAASHGLTTEAVIKDVVERVAIP
jgi:MoxR-like ATPase